MKKKLTLMQAKKYLISREVFHKLQGKKLDVFCDNLVKLEIMDEAIDFLMLAKKFEKITWAYNGFLINRLHTKTGVATVTFPDRETYNAYKDDYASYLIYCLNHGEYSNADNVYLHLLYLSSSAGVKLSGDNIRKSYQNKS
jgi:hypothetical protein